jgi:hypothetical protein
MWVLEMAQEMVHVSGHLSVVGLALPLVLGREQASVPAKVPAWAMV